MDYLGEMLSRRNADNSAGIWSCCSANEYVIRAAIRRAKERNIPALIEATANQVDQTGGYTGMRPADFRDYVLNIARQEGLPEDRLILGGDHLGPLTFAKLPEKVAMEKARELVRLYVEAGYTKIHLDTSMPLAGDGADFGNEIIARRGAELCKVAEEAFVQRRKDHPDALPPRYVIGSEVPIPGGAKENEDSVAVTKSEDFFATVSAFETAYAAQGLKDAWSRVIAVVVQPGVEFGDNSVVRYSREKAAHLISAAKNIPHMVLEGHSTDYQPRKLLREMVEDGIAILKVGPALTFALREGLFALENIERELNFTKPSNLRAVMDDVMIENPRYWECYYHGSPAEQQYARSFSLSDRCRYYLPDTRISASAELLMKNLSSVQIPLALLWQYMPRQADRVSGGILGSMPIDLVIDHVGDRMDDYLYAVGATE